MSEQPCVRSEWLEEGAVLRLVLDRPKGNVLDAAMVGGLRQALAEARGRTALRAVLLEGEGSHFSFGASVEEHLPESVAGMLAAFHGLFKDLVALERPLLAAVRGQCLGGGLELAAFCHRVFAAPGAHLGQPELRLGVMAPVGSFLLPRRVGQARADDLLLGGHAVDAEEALRIGLVDEIAEDPGATALAYAKAHFLDKSAASLRVAVHAARWEFDRAFLAHIDALEALYLDRLMALADAKEGIRAFLEKRAPVWQDA
jgi:cyclohexa-1,5-dienecarbonyl-CoA hydratase